MKIWFDISNSPHINIFKDFIRELQKEHEIIITARPLANTIELLKIHNFQFTIIGEHYGANFLMKVFGYPIRVIQLFLFLRKQKPDVAISHSSFHSPVVARLLGIPSIYINDNEHAMGNIPAFICATKILVPEFMPDQKLKRQCASENKLIKYPGLKEGFYLCKSFNLLSKKNSSQIKKRVYVRPEPSTAQYYKGNPGFMDALLIDLSKRMDVTVLPRNESQSAYYKATKFQGVFVLEKPLPLGDIVQNCDLFIGAGGTMTREMAVLGVPTISIYQSELLAVDTYLIKQGYMIHDPGINAKGIMQFLNEFDQKVHSSSGLLKKGEEAYNLIKRTLLELGG